MAGQRWRSDEGWPYADWDGEVADPGGEPDWDVLSLHQAAPHLFDCLDPLEKQVVMARFGLAGGGQRSMKELRRETGLDGAALRCALGSGIAKLRAELADDR